VKFVHLTNLLPRSSWPNRLANVFCFLAFSLTGLDAARAQDNYATREDVRGFIAHMVDKHGFEEARLLEIFSKVRHSDDALRLISPPPSGFKRSWKVYRSRFIEPVRINDGLKFWRRNATDIDRAANQFGVPAEVIVSIIGVETIYGRNTGNFRVLDVLSTIGFNYPRRAEFFKGEVEAFLILARDRKFDPFSVLGSYAGAIGLPQFMPSSILRFGHDHDDDGQIDLRANPADAVGSVARFLSMHGWQTGKQATYSLSFEENARIDELVSAGIEPQFTAAQLREFGIKTGANIPAEEKLALIDLPNADEPTTYLLGARNFYVVTRYNRSSFYAQAVLELAVKLREGMDSPETVAQRKPAPKKLAPKKKRRKV
jgi:membrane-bound lytic murein transglycosylase B